MKEGDGWGGETQHVLIGWSGKIKIWSETKDWEAKGKLEEEEFRKGEDNVIGPVGKKLTYILKEQKGQYDYVKPKKRVVQEKQESNHVGL